MNRKDLVPMVIPVKVSVACPDLGIAIANLRVPVIQQDNNKIIRL